MRSKSATELIFQILQWSQLNLPVATKTISFEMKSMARIVCETRKARETIERNYYQNVFHKRTKIRINNLISNSNGQFWRGFKKFPRYSSRWNSNQIYLFTFVFNLFLSLRSFQKSAHKRHYHHFYHRPEI